MNEILKEDAIEIINDNNGLKELYGSNFLVIGASGMIGSYFVNTLLLLNEMYDANINIYLMLRNKNKLPDYVQNNPNVTILEHDVSVPFDYDVNMDYIVHAASPASPKIMKEKPVETNFANTLGAANALMYAKKSNSKGFLFISSREIYGQPEEGQELFYEDGKYGQVNPLEPRNGYAEGKKAAENMCVGFNTEYGVNAKIARLAHTYGPGMSIYDGRVQADFLKNIVNSEDIVLKSKGESIRTYTYIGDAVNALLKILLYSSDIVYNVADEKNKTSILQLAQTLVNIYPERGLELRFDIPESSKNDGTASFTLGILSTKKIREELKWEPKYSIAEGFKRTIDYLESTLLNDDKIKLSKTKQK